MLAFDIYEDSNEKMCIRTSLTLQYVIYSNKYASLYIDHIIKRQKKKITCVSAKPTNTNLLCQP